jgi:ABC-2 type transport system permease protein
LVTGVGFLIASAGRDLLSVMAWGILAIVVLAIPSFAVLFTGTGSAWSKMIPSYYMVDTVHRAANFGLGWSDAWRNLVILLGFDVLILGLGILMLRRRFK